MGLQKHTNLAGYALGNILKYHTKSAAIIIALVFSTGLLGSVEFIREGIVVDLSASVEEGPDIVVQKLIGGRQVDVPLDWKSNLTATTGVRIATPRVWGYSDIGGGKLITIMGINITEYGSIVGPVGTDIVGEGRFLEESDQRRMIVGQGIVDMMNSAYSPVHVSVNSTLGLIAQNGSTIDFQVVGVFSSEAKIFSYDMILTDIDSARELFGHHNSSHSTDFAVWAVQGTNLNDVAFRIDTRLTQSRVLTRDAIRDTMMMTYGDRAGIIALLWAILLMSVVLAAFNASSAGSEEARREVGLLKALGFDTVDILEIRMFEGLTLSLLGASFGFSVAIIYTYVLGAPGIAGYLLGWNLVLLNWGIPLAISFQTVFIVYMISVIPILIATVVPSWRNAITEPDVVLRGV